MFNSDISVNRACTVVVAHLHGPTTFSDVRLPTLPGEPANAVLFESV